MMVWRKLSVPLIESKRNASAVMNGCGGVQHVAPGRLNRFAAQVMAEVYAV